MPTKYDPDWENALSVVQEVQPPFFPEGAHAMLEGEMLFELEGQPSRVIRAGRC
ncbi:hypothetical protein [Mycobacterium sp. ACS1612]|uniref:hypothetical protein n=1 Tax=Mycobacterium sp. ACS1612 TaxID=1834117 RepID=UPI000A517C80